MVLGKCLNRNQEDKTAVEKGNRGPDAADYSKERDETLHTLEGSKSRKSVRKERTEKGSDVNPEVHIGVKRGATPMETEKAVNGTKSRMEVTANSNLRAGLSEQLRENQ